MCVCVSLLSVNRYKEANTRLRKLLADERRSLQQVRLNYSQELKTRTEMEMLLRACVEDVRKEIARRWVGGGGDCTALHCCTAFHTPRIHVYMLCGECDVF